LAMADPNRAGGIVYTTLALITNWSGRREAARSLPQSPDMPSW